MAKIEREVKHTMALDDAKKTVAVMVDGVLKQHSAFVTDVKWNDDKTAAKVSGKGFKGDFCVDDKCIKLNVELGLVASAFKGTVEKMIDEKLAEIK